MTESELERPALRDALERFRAAADAKETARSTREDHRLHEEMTKAARELYGLGEAGRSRFAALLHDPSPGVRSWVAAQLLSEGRPEAVTELEELSQREGAIGLDAQLTLEEHRAGRLGSPFGIPDPLLGES